MNQEHDASKQSHIDMYQLPITQGAEASPVDLLASRIGDNHGNAAQADKTCNPTHGQPGPGEMSVQSVPSRGPEYRAGNGDDCDYPTNVKNLRGNVSLVNVATDCVGSVFENNSDGILRFAEVLTRVNAHECARWAVF